MWWVSYRYKRKVVNNVQSSRRNMFLFLRNLVHLRIPCNVGFLLIPKKEGWKVLRCCIHKNEWEDSEERSIDTIYLKIPVKHPDEKYRKK